MCLRDLEFSKLPAHLRPVGIQFWNLAVVVNTELSISPERREQCLKKLLEARNIAVDAVNELKKETV